MVSLSRGDWHRHNANEEEENGIENDDIQVAIMIVSSGLENFWVFELTIELLKLVFIYVGVEYKTMSKFVRLCFRIPNTCDQKTDLRSEGHVNLPFFILTSRSL